MIRRTLGLTLPHPRHESKDVLRGSVALALVLVTIVNILQFPNIEQDAGTYYSAVSSHGDASLKSIVQNHMSTTRQRFLMYVELGQLTNEPTVLVDPDAWVHTEELYGLSGAKNVVEPLEDISIGSAQAQTLREQATRTGRQREAGEYVIAVATGSSQKKDQLVILVEHDEVLYLIGQSWSVLPAPEKVSADG